MNSVSPSSGSNGAISMAPMVANGDRHCRQWMSPLAPMAIVIAIGATDRIAIGDNGASIGATYCRHWRQWRQMIHSPNYLTLLPKPVYAVFVDFRKAFDSVCREALFLKLAKLGIRGKIFETLSHMYSNSTAQIKLSGHLSNKFPIRKGTEQGHPLSPDLFKIYIKDLSPSLDFDECPRLLNTIVSHLLWADDLIILALDPTTLQKQLNIFDEFCKDWGIEINVDKTKLIRFNSNYDNDRYTQFKIGNHSLKEVESYCYLGMEIHKNGSFSPARTILSNKAMRALYSLKSTINKSKLSFRSLTTLFDSLIKPITLYGAPIYTPDMYILKHIAELAKNSSRISHTAFLRKISQLDCEKTHLHFLKWALGVNRKASNVGVWGESGRYPLIYERINLTIKYFKRVYSLQNNSLVSLACKEQTKMNLDWYRGIKPLISIDKCFDMDHVTAFNHRKIKGKTTGTDDLLHEREKSQSILHKGHETPIPPHLTITPNHCGHFTPFVVLKQLKQNFKTSWHACLNSSSKLDTYCSIKDKFAKEAYLDIVKAYKDRVSLTRLRISAHTLEIEIGRRKSIPRDGRICKWCNISLGADIIENESHFLDECDLYAKLRRSLYKELHNFPVEPQSQPQNIIQNILACPSRQYTRRTIVRRELARTRANSSELARTPRELANGSPTPRVRRTPPDVRRSTPNVRRSSAEFARVRPSSRALRRELANGSPENSFAGRNLPTSNGRSPRTGSPRT